MKRSKVLYFSKPAPLPPNTRAVQRKGYRGEEEVPKGVPITDSIYYWWFEYLKRSEKYKMACAKDGKGMKRLYGDFGDIFSYKNDISGFTNKHEFWRWWEERGPELFGGNLIKQITGFVNFEDAMSLQSDIENGSYKLIAVPTNLKKSVIRQEVGSLITSLKVKDVRTEEIAGTKYRVSNARVDVKSLKLCLSAYDLKMTGMGNREIYAELHSDKLTDEEKEWAVEDRRGIRGVFEDWETAEPENIDNIDSDVLYKQSKEEKVEEKKRVERAESIADRKMKWREQKGRVYKDAAGNRIRDELSEDEIYRLRELYVDIELGLATRTQQAEHITKRKNYFNTYVSRLLKKAKVNISAVEKSQFPLSH